MPSHKVTVSGLRHRCLLDIYAVSDQFYLTPNVDLYTLHEYQHDETIKLNDSDFLQVIKDIASGLVKLN